MTEQVKHKKEVSAIDMIEIATRLGFSKDIKRVDDSWFDSIYVGVQNSIIVSQHLVKEFKVFIDALKESKQGYAYIYAVGLSDVDEEEQQAWCGTQFILDNYLCFSTYYTSVCLLVLEKAFSGGLFQLIQKDANS